MRIEADIKGYRQLSEEEQERINSIKELADRVGCALQVDLRHALLPVDMLHPGDPGGANRRWMNIAADHLQQGFMAWVRAVAKPETF